MNMFVAAVDKVSSFPRSFSGLRLIILITISGLSL